MNSDTTFLINSCDKYEDAWHPFFECLWHFAGELSYPIILNTETKCYSSPHYPILCVNTDTKKRLTWSERLLHVLDSVQTEFVFFLLEDYFLKDTFDRCRFEKVIKYMKENPDVCIVDIRPRWAENMEEKAANQKRFLDIEDSFIERNNEKFNITCSPGVWRTEALRSLLRTHEDVWDFERYVGVRAKKYGWKVIRFDTRTPAVYDYDDQILGSGMGITAGHWLPENKPFFEKLGITVNYDRLGIMDAKSIDEIRKQVRRNPVNLIKKIPTKIRKQILRKKSLV